MKLPQCYTLTIAMVLMGTASTWSNPVSARVAEDDVSTLRLPVNINLARAFEVMERELPLVIDRTGAWEFFDSGRFALKYRITRQPLGFSLDWNRLTVVFEAGYSVRLGRKVLGTVVSVASCGFDSEPPRRVRATVDAVVTVDAAYRISLTSAIRSLEFVDRCEVTFADIDVTPEIAAEIRPKLEEALAKLDALARELDLRGPVQQAWDALATPTHVSRDGVWLVVDPKTIAIGPLIGSGSLLATTIEFTASTSMVLAEPDTSPRPPLPPLGLTSGGTGFVIVLTANVPFDWISKALCDELRDKPVEVGGRSVTIVDVTISGEGEQVRIRAHISSPFDVVVTMAGRLVYDRAEQLLRAERLDFTAESRNSLTTVLAQWFLDSPDFRAQATDAARVSLKGHIGAARSMATSLLSKHATDTISGQLTLTAIEPEFRGADAAAREFRVAVVVSGTASMSVR